MMVKINTWMPTVTNVTKNTRQSNTTFKRCTFVDLCSRDNYSAPPKALGANEIKPVFPNSFSTGTVLVARLACGTPVRTIR